MRCSPGLANYARNLLDVGASDRVTVTSIATSRRTSRARQASTIIAERKSSYDRYFNRLQTRKVYGLTISGPRNQQRLKGLADAAAANPFRLPRNHPGIRRCGDDNGMADTPVEESKVNREELRVIEEATVDVACHLSLIRVWDPTSVLSQI